MRLRRVNAQGGGIDKLAKGEFHKAFEEALRAGDRRVSDESLKEMSRALRMPVVETKPRT